MCQIIRAQYRAALKEGTRDEKLLELVEVCRERAEQKRKDGSLLTAAMFRYNRLVFLYIEYIGINSNVKVEAIPDVWFSDLSAVLYIWPELSGNKNWAYMFPVFWFDQPESLTQWKRKKKPDRRCGRIAVLYPEQLFSYVCHHQAIVKEGLLVGDRYQMISLHENLLFSYFEIPREREQVNIRQIKQESEEIKAWMAANPESHFYHFPEAKGENFLIISELFTVG
ncbi:hypothetical protein [Cellulosilyticum sp. I15G10I2]|uniref:hypothetical protein n=1 Tax=Cellulosilyticum sp. I15G10I2 TaxID=1892843 RepID=UPI00085C8184|nr:hypothetical protein [Cellulosilyticum sp. I15G10I2]